MLYFTLSGSLSAQEMNIILTDLQGRTVWTGHRGGIAIHGGSRLLRYGPHKAACVQAPTS